MLGQLMFKACDEFLAVFLLALGLFGIETQDISHALHAVANDHLLGLEVVLEDCMLTSFQQDIALDLRNIENGSQGDGFLNLQAIGQMVIVSVDLFLVVFLWGDNRSGTGAPVVHDQAGPV
jgi:hypothetical protein